MSDEKNSFDKKKHKREVNKLRVIKKQRRMKRNDRADDVAPGASYSVESFCVDTMPQEENQDEWLNDLIDETPTGSPQKRRASAEADDCDFCCIQKYPALIVGVAVALVLNYFLRRSG